MATNYTAVHAMERIECKNTFPEYVKQHATVTRGPLKGKRVIDLSEKEKIALELHDCVMSGKLYGVAAISTAPTVNPNCILAIQNPDSPCHYCFSVKTMAMYNALREWLENNARILSSREITEKEAAALVKRFEKSSENKVLRIEPFGDAINRQDTENKVKIANKAAAAGFNTGWWTKLPHVIDAGIKEKGRPENTTLIYSAPCLDQTDVPAAAAYDWIDCVFVVCDDIDATEKALQDSGKKTFRCHCEKGACSKSCKFCYSRESRKENNDGEITYILEEKR